jgi:hypothetical protein
MMVFGACDAQPVPSMLHLATTVFLIENVLFKDYYNPTSRNLQKDKVESEMIV